VAVTTSGAGKVTVREICQKYLQTVQDQAESTRVNKEIMLTKAQQHWEDLPVRNLKKSDILEWFAPLKLGTSWQNQHLRPIRAGREITRLKVAIVFPNLL
jgi:hypothetical protein